METNGLNIKSGFASIIGLPNAGKSTFLNAVINEKLAITSKKPQTTRKNLKGIYNDEESQIVFVDTPGINKGSTELDKYMEKAVSSSIDDIDVIIVIVDIMTYENDDYNKIIKKIEKSPAKKILFINKYDVYDGNLDKVKFEILDKFSGKIAFDNIIFISALKNKNIETAVSAIKNVLNYGAKFYDDTYITDEPTKKIISDMIRQQCLYKLDKEIPHSLEVIVESMKLSKTKCMNINATIICDKESHKKIIIGSKGMMIKNIGTGARINIEKFLDRKVNLKLNVIVKNNWRDEKTLLANFGYDMKKL
ncbi:MAG: GTPase Era [Lachnospiraceae bacterium]|nr:GTPase Era [Lachnospiraceae bacterium]